MLTIIIICIINLNNITLARLEFLLEESRKIHLAHKAYSL